MQIFKTSKAKENILRKIRLAIQDQPLPIPFPEVENFKSNTVFKNLAMDSLEETFAYEFTKSGGHFIFCKDKTEALENFKSLVEKRNWQEVLCAPKKLFTYLIHKKLSYIREFTPFINKEAPACITDCEVAIARTGSILLSSKQDNGRISSIYYPVHIFFLSPQQLVKDIEDGIQFMTDKYKGAPPSLISFATGPSTSTSIEAQVNIGAYGPKEVFCFFINE